MGESMFFIRPLCPEDGEALWLLANQTGLGFTSLQPNKDKVDEKLDWTVKSFNQDSSINGKLYMFAIEDSETRKMVGVSALKSAVGANDIWYNFRILTEIKTNSSFNITIKKKMLQLVNDHSECSELCTLFLLPEYRKQYNGHLLSKSRMLFLSIFKELFHTKVIAEMRGKIDEKGVSPFWESLGRHFFDMDFSVASQAVLEGKKFVAELLPNHPVYLDFLSKEAREAIGKVHDQTVPALKLLKRENMKFSNCIDILDGGPLLEAETTNLRIFRDAKRLEAKITTKKLDGPLFLISNEQFKGFRCLVSKAMIDDNNRVLISKEQANQLHLTEGETLRIAPLFENQN